MLKSHEHYLFPKIADMPDDEFHKLVNVHDVI